MTADGQGFTLAKAARGLPLALLDTEFGGEPMVMAEADEDDGLLVPPAGIAFVGFAPKEIWV